MNKEKYRFIIKEYYLRLARLNELEVFGDDEGPDEKGILGDPEAPEEVSPETAGEITPQNYPNLGGSISRVASRLSADRLKLDNKEIEKILRTGKSRMNHENYVGESQEKKDEFEYVTSVVGELYKSVNSDKKTNIRDFLFGAFLPYSDTHGSSSKLARMIARKAGITYDLTGTKKTADYSEYMEKLAEAIYEAIDLALASYRPDETSFGRWLTITAASKAIDLIKSKASKVAFTGYGKFSGDEPISGGEDDGGDETFMTTLTSREDDFTAEQKEMMKNVYDAIGAFVRRKLGENPRFSTWIEFYELFGEQGRGMEEISEITGISYGALRALKMRFEKHMTEFVQNKTLTDFIYEKAGIKVKFPNNKFSLAQGGSDSTKKEPMYIFKQDDTHPEGGEWVEMERPKKGRKLPKDYLANIAFGEKDGGKEGNYDEEYLSEIRNMIHSVIYEAEMFQEKAEEMEEERIVNPDSKYFVKNKENFIGSHVWGEAVPDGSYIAVSYGEQFPIYIYWSKTNKWYENADKYIYNGEVQDSTEQHKEDLRPTDKTHKKAAMWMRKLLKSLKRTNGLKSLEHLSVVPGEKN
jgi:DNA-directed RNA polymerase specialized sigma24 family protein